MAMTQCVVCGEEFRRSTSAKTCSPTCRRERRRITKRAFNRRWKKTPKGRACLRRYAHSPKGRARDPRRRARRNHGAERKCVICGWPLTGRQQKTCGMQHRRLFNLQKQRHRSKSPQYRTWRQLWNNSPKGRAPRNRKKSPQSAKKRASDRRWSTSFKGRASRQRYDRSERRRELAQAWEHSPKGLATRMKYQLSEAGRAKQRRNNAQKRIMKSAAELQIGILKVGKILKGD